MGVSSLEDISYVKKDVKESLIGTLNTTKTIIFKHEASAGDLIIDTTALVVPSEAAANGFTQPSAAEVASINMLVNKNNLKIHSSRGIWLQMYEDFKIIGANQIRLIGSIADLGGALEGEVFTVYAQPILSNSILTTDHKKQHQEYILAEGQTVLNLGREYEVGRNIGSQIGAIRIFRNGIGPQLRNVGNAAAAPLADGNYQEIDAGNGLGTTIEFNLPASGQDDVIVVEFGLEYAGDFSLVGDIQSIWGSILKLAEDVKDLGPYDITRYVNANPSEVERRTFGDAVLGLLDIPIYQHTEPENAGPTVITATVTAPTKGSMHVDRVWRHRAGKFLVCRYEFRPSSNGTAGSGSYLWEIPLNGLQIDPAFLYEEDFAGGNYFGPYIGSGGGSQESNGDAYSLHAHLYDNTRFWLICDPGPNDGFVGSGNAPLSLSPNLFWEIKVPIVGWTETKTAREILGL